MQPQEKPKEQRTAPSQGRRPVDNNHPTPNTTETFTGQPSHGQPEPVAILDLPRSPAVVRHSPAALPPTVVSEKPSEEPQLSSPPGGNMPPASTLWWPHQELGLLPGANEVPSVALFLGRWSRESSFHHNPGVKWHPTAEQCLWSSKKGWYQSRARRALPHPLLSLGSHVLLYPKRIRRGGVELRLPFPPGSNKVARAGPTPAKTEGLS